MDSGKSGEQAAPRRLPHVRGWFLVLAGLAVGAAYLYYLQIEKQKNFINSYYFRTLQEVATEFNNNLGQLDTLHQFGQNTSTIQSIFTSYKKDTDKRLSPTDGAQDSDVPGAGTDGSQAGEGVASTAGGAGKPEPIPDATTAPGEIKIEYRLEANRVRIDKEGDGTYYVDISDLLRKPGSDFVIFVVADARNRVLGSAGGEAGLSMINTDVISRAIQVRENQDWLKLATKQGGETPQLGTSLPGYSTQIDVTLNTGRSRVFVLPFMLYHKISIPPLGNVEEDKTFRSTGGVPMYLVGVQPDKVIESYENKRWNLSLLLLSLVALVFLWTITRLLMLSRHQPLGDGFYRVTVAASHLTFILVVALLAAYAHRTGEIAQRKAKAATLMQAVQADLHADLKSVFESLRTYHQFYSRLVAAGGKTGNGQALDPPGDDSSPLSCSHEALACDGPCMVVELDNHYEICTFPQSDLARVADTLAAGEIDAPSPLVVTTSGGSELTLPRFSNINVYPPHARVNLKRPGQADSAEWKRNTIVSEWFDTPGVDQLDGEGRLLGVFLMDHNGQQVLPVFYFTENNLRPDSYNLAHRDYFRRVRDRNGWTVNFSEKAQGGTGETAVQDTTPTTSYRNFYIQRLLNLNTGTRGTTIGMPLEVPGPAGAPAAVNGEHFLGADIVLPSLSLAPWLDAEAVQDLVVMVIDRGSGQVLFHMDDKRSMVENLYQSGSGTTDISQAVRAGRIRDRGIPGYYHGDSGIYMVEQLPVSQWLSVVFIPDASTDSLMTDTFLVTAIGMGSTVLVLTCLLGLLRRYRDTETRKFQWGLPGSLNSHGIMLFTSLLLGSIYLAYWMGEAIDKQLKGWTSGFVAWLGIQNICILLAMALILLWGHSLLHRLQRQDRQWEKLRANASRGVALLLAFNILAGLGVAIYLNVIGNRPDQALSWYYRNLNAARLNKEQQELHEIALSRFPNTIKQHAADPLGFLPIGEEWRKCLSASQVQVGRRSRDKQPVVLPEHIGTFSQFTATTDAYSWLRIFLLTPARESNPERVCVTDPDAGDRGADGVPDGGGTAGQDAVARDAPAGGDARENTGIENRAEVANKPAVNWTDIVEFLLVITGAFLLMCTGWYFFYRRVLGARLFGAVGLTEHLRHIVENNTPERAYAPKPGLVLDLHCRRHAGENFGALLLRCASEEQRQAMPDLARQGMGLLTQECPWLKTGACETDPFPGANISFTLKPPVVTTGSQADAPVELLAVQLSDLDVCLSQAPVRKDLLRLLRQLKAMHLAGQLARLQVDLGFHSYESMLLKAHNTDAEREPMSPAEFAEWAETLMDFRVDLPAELTGQLEPAFVKFECSGSRLLRELEGELLRELQNPVPPVEWRQLRRWLGLRDVDKTSREWATVNCILLKAGALFRHKWETCSSAEKLALYYLARRKRINTANAQLLEQMSLQGLIRVDHGGIRIVNNTFAYFARHAEDAATLRGLVEIAEVGAWQEYRLPVTLVVLLLLGGIAFTSGSSMYMIIASLLGLLGTIGSLTNSAKMIKENLR